MAGAKLIAPKKNECDVSPIAMGSCIRRLVVKSVCFQMEDVVANYLTPHEYEVCTPGGSEMLTHLVQLCLQQHPDWVEVKLDATDVFNTVRRKSILSELALHLFHSAAVQPSILPTKVNQSTC